MTFGEVLKHFKESESAENIVPLLDDDKLRSSIVAWKSVIIEHADSEPCSEKSEAAQWEWMWRKVTFDLRSFGVVSGCRPQDTLNLFQRLKGLRLIYPDGSISTFAASYLQSIILAKLPKQKAPSGV